MDGTIIQKFKNSKIGCMDSGKKIQRLDVLKVHELNVWNQKENNLEMGCMELNKKNSKIGCLESKFKSS